LSKQVLKTTSAEQHDGISSPALDRVIRYNVELTALARA
jgi:hypothetical protein